MIGVVLMLAAAFSNASASVLQRRATKDEPDSRAFSLRMFLDLARRPSWFLGITAIARRRADELAFGERKLVDLGRALMPHPGLVLLDEPTAGLFEAQKAWLARVLSRIPAEFGAAVLVIDHDMRLALGVSSRVAVMDFGHKIADATPGEVRADPVVIAAYLGGGPRGHAAPDQ